MISSGGQTADRGAGREPRAPAELVGAAQLGGEGQRGRGTGQAAGEQVVGDLPAPHRRLENRLAVVGDRVTARLGRRRRLSPGTRLTAGLRSTAAAIPPPSASARRAVARQIEPRSRVVSTGSGGSP